MKGESKEKVSDALILAVQHKMAQGSTRTAAKDMERSRTTLYDLIKTRTATSKTRRALEKYFGIEPDVDEDQIPFERSSPIDSSASLTHSAAVISHSHKYGMAPFITALAFEDEARKRQNSETAFKLMPELVYEGNRFGSDDILDEIISNEVIPYLEAHGKSLKIDPSVKANLTLQVACVWNETKIHDEAIEVFSKSEYLLDCKCNVDIDKIKIQIDRNHSCGLGWLGSEHYAKAFERLGEARRPSGDDHRYLRNEISISNVGCEINLKAGKTAKAWEAAESSYFKVKNFFGNDGKFKGPSELGFLHAYGALYYGVISRLLNHRALNYSRSAQDEDIALLDACLKKAGGEIRIAHLAPLTPGASVTTDFSRFLKIINSTRRIAYGKRHRVYKTLMKLLKLCSAA